MYPTFRSEDKPEVTYLPWGKIGQKREREREETFVCIFGPESKRGVQGTLPALIPFSDFLY